MHCGNVAISEVLQVRLSMGAMLEQALGLLSLIQLN